MLESMKQRSVLLVAVIDFVAGKGLEVADGDGVGHKVADATTIVNRGLSGWAGWRRDLLFDELEQLGSEINLFGDAKLAGLGE